MKIHTMEQYSDEWWEVRKGLPTASVAGKILTPGGKLSASSKPLCHALIADSLGLGDPPIEPNEWMIRGTEMEGEARDFFTFETGLQVSEVGFITNDTGTLGLSPDGLIPHKNTVDVWNGGLEIKCPKPSTHIGYLLANRLPPAYAPQVHWSMAVSGLNHWWFLSYHPELDPLLIKVERDEYTEKMEKAGHEMVLMLCAMKEELGL